MMKKTLLFNVVAVAAVLSWCGCVSFRFCGDVPQRSSEAVTAVNKYRLVKILYSSGNGFFRLGQMSSWSGPDECGSIPGVARILDEAAMISEVTRRAPDMLTTADGGIPLEVKLLMRSESVERRVSQTLLTLGFWPGEIDGVSRCEVTVTAPGDEDTRESCDVLFRMQRKISCFIPSALFAYDGVPDAVSCRTGNRVDQLADWQAVFTETLEAGIKECVRKLERRAQEKQ